MRKQASVVVVGGGIVGLATAMEWTARYPGLPVVVLEKEQEVARHQTGHNSGVIHSGIYYKPGSLKAQLCVAGVTSLHRFCEERGIPFETCGKLIVATSEEELPRLDELYRRGVGNGLHGIRKLEASEIREYEPHAAGLRGIHVPITGVVDYFRVAKEYAEVISSRGGQIQCSCEVRSIRRSGNATVVETNLGEIETRLLVNCAGLHSDRVSRMSGAKLDLTIVPFRGEYYNLAKDKEWLVRGLLYPVPDPRFPFLGVHFTRRIGGGVEAGPNAVLALAREGYEKQDFRAGDVLGYATFPGFWIMAAKYGKIGAEEYYRSWSKRAFARSLQKLVPEITEADLVPGGSGVRAQALSRNGKLIDDFSFAYANGVLHVCNVPSPAATASLAIAKHVTDTIVSHAGDPRLNSSIAVPSLEQANI
ncbi:MAG TPA: L-2-hydroxyglutarate oxidase [Bryobacteraceae bacterium]|nr:L-2-hydroxyglutarate oxidase [Bryobacteraceae bacterium]